MKLGILGGGQLGQMLALAARPLDIDCIVLDPHEDAPAGRVARLLRGAFDDEAALGAFAERVDVVTYEFENVPLQAAETLASRRPLLPGARALAVSQDRVSEKQLFWELGIPTVSFAPVDSHETLAAAVANVGLPALLKTRRHGYDGKGQRWVFRAQDAATAWSELGQQPSIMEAKADYRAELSIVAVRGRDGEMAFYPVVENVHEDGILRETHAPAPALSPEIQELAEGYVRRVAEAFDYVGVLTLELFQVGTQLLANELAPRVHNSGHWTIEGAETSQFENHVRAVVGLPLGSTAPRGHSTMLNLLSRFSQLDAVLRIPGAHLHLYGKAPRLGRKLGHITVCTPEIHTTQALAGALRAFL